MSDFAEDRPGWRQVNTAPSYASGVSAHTWKRLSIHVGRALQKLGSRGASQLRQLVPLVVQEMRLVDAPWEAIERAVENAVTEHPEFGRYNRLNVVTGREETEPLIAWMLEFVQRERTAARRPGGGHPRLSKLVAPRFRDARI